MPPCMGKTIAAVFLRLSAASVKGLLSWLLLSALLLQLSEPVSDALLFGRSYYTVFFTRLQGINQHVDKIVSKSDVLYWKIVVLMVKYYKTSFWSLKDGRNTQQQRKHASAYCGKARASPRLFERERKQNARL